jgi:uncharacterized repeat protein (TIGR01451 family)
MKHSAMLLGLLAVATAAQAQQPMLAPLPPGAASPLLYVRFAGPPGMHVVWHPWQVRPRDTAAPAVFGLRPGYIYRMELNGIAGLPGVSLYPTLEVRGSLRVPPRVNARAFPAPVVLNETDLEQVLHGSLIVKVLYLEDPERAEPFTTTLDHPQETNLPPARDLLGEAHELGRPMLIFRLGQRQVAAEELARCTVPGTVLFPGENAIAMPPVGPMLPYACWQWYDPIHGPRFPKEEIIHNGGSTAAPPSRTADGRLGSPVGQRAGLGSAGELIGLQPEDAVAEYTDAAGNRRLACSNRICLCVPRFAVLRTEIPLAAQDTVERVTAAAAANGFEQIRVRLPGLLAQQIDKAKAAQGRERPSVNIGVEGIHVIQRIEILDAERLAIGPFQLLFTAQAQHLEEVEKARMMKQILFARQLSQREGVQENDLVIGTAVVARVEHGPEVIRATVETRSITICCNECPQEVTDKPLCLFKWADRHAAQVGEVVTFSLRYSNQGGKPMTDVAVTDSLSTRLEYIPGTAKSDRDAVFTTQENEVGSQILRWEISGRLLPGDSGVVRFQARVR